MVYICSMKTHKTRYKIGEFSRMMQVTVKTLRHYEQKGLLLPSEVDQWTGYRYYIDGAWNQPEPEKWVSIIQSPVE